MKYGFSAALLLLAVAACKGKDAATAEEGTTQAAVATTTTASTEHPDPYASAAGPAGSAGSGGAATSSTATTAATDAAPAQSNYRWYKPWTWDEKPRDDRSWREKSHDASERMRDRQQSWQERFRMRARGEDPDAATGSGG